MITLDATDVDNDIVLYHINSGADQSLFNIDSATGKITFKSKPDFENPRDTNGDNTYELYVSVNDSQGHSDFTHVFVQVSNIKYEGATPKASSYKLTQTLEATTPAASDYYGEIVATNGELVAVLSEKENSNKGVIYLYDKGIKVALHAGTFLTSLINDTAAPV